MLTLKNIAFGLSDYIHFNSTKQRKLQCMIILSHWLCLLASKIHYLFLAKLFTPFFIKNNINTLANKYLDDILTYSSNFEEHINSSQFGSMKLKLNRCEFAKFQVNYLWLWNFKQSLHIQVIWSSSQIL